MLKKAINQESKYLLSRKLVSYFLVGCVACLLVSSCACSASGKPNSRKTHNDIAMADAQAAPRTTQKIGGAVAYLNPVGNHGVKGRVEFKKTPQGMRVLANVEGLMPGEHGFHIHEHGSCGGKDASEAGVHFNPTSKPHAGPDTDPRHIGDLGNIKADENGYGHYEQLNPLLTFEGDFSIIGKTVIIHADPDDYKTQPSGASGGRISCGVIEAVMSSN